MCQSAIAKNCGYKQTSWAHFALEYNFIETPLESFFIYLHARMYEHNVTE